MASRDSSPFVLGDPAVPIEVVVQQQLRRTRIAHTGPGPILRIAQDRVMGAKASSNRGQDQQMSSAKTSEVRDATIAQAADGATEPGADPAQGKMSQAPSYDQLEMDEDLSEADSKDGLPHRGWEW